MAADGPLFSPDGTTLWVPQSTFLLRFSFDPTTGTATQTAAIPLCGSPLNQPQCDPNTGPSNASGAELPSGHGATRPDGNSCTSPSTALTSSASINTADRPRAELDDSGRQRAAPGGHLAGRRRPPTSPTRVAGRPSPATSPTCPTAPRSCRASRPAGRSPGTVSVVNLAHRQGDPGDPGRAAAHRALPGWHGSVRGQLQRRQPVGDRRARQSGHPDGEHQPGPRARRVGSYANAINMVRPQPCSSASAVTTRSPSTGIDGLYRPMRSIGPAPDRLVPGAGPARSGSSAPATIVVTNDKGIGAQGPPSTINKGPYTAPGAEPVTDHNTYDDTGSVTMFSHADRGRHPSGDTQTVFTDNDWEQIKPINQGDYDTVPKVIPAHLGDPSPIKHVVVIVRENRTYDQVLGDLGEGNGDPADAQFGATDHAERARAGVPVRRPRQLLRRGHALGRRAQLDRPGRGERLRREGVRGVLPLVPVAGRRRARLPARRLPLERRRESRPERAELRRVHLQPVQPRRPTLPRGTPGTRSRSGSRTGTSGPSRSATPASTRRCSPTSRRCRRSRDPCFPNFQLSIPDQYRVDQWLPVFQQQKQVREDAQADVHVADDRPHHRHRCPGSGGAGGRQRPRGRPRGRRDLHSKFWKSTAIFVVEDDTQNGVDHVDGHRGPAFVISPYSGPASTTTTTRSSTWSRRSSRSSGSGR